MPLGDKRVILSPIYRPNEEANLDPMTASPCLIFLTSPYKTFDVIIFNEFKVLGDTPL